MLTSFMICLSFKSCNLLVWFSSGSCKQVLPHRHMRCDTKHSLMWNLKSVNNYFLKAAQYWPQIRVSAVWCAFIQQVNSTSVMNIGLRVPTDICRCSPLGKGLSFKLEKIAFMLLSHQVCWWLIFPRPKCFFKHIYDIWKLLLAFSFVYLLCFI